MSLLASWAKRYFSCRDKNWVSLVDYEYLTRKPNLLYCKENVGSPFWKGLTWALAGARPFYRWELGNGDNISFWHVTWAGDCSLKTQFWVLFDICQQENCTTKQVWDGHTLKLTFRRCVGPGVLHLWNMLKEVVSNFLPSSEADRPVWTLEASGIYTTKSFYKQIN